MRDQYASDISDFLKYALLRVLARDDYELGVAWYYNKNHDGRNDGQHTEYILESRWKQLDEQLWNELKNFHDAFQQCPALRTVRNLEKLKLWPANTLFHGTEDGEEVPRFARDRPNWVDCIRQKLEKSRILFLDPDNSVHIHPTIRHASYQEVGHLRKSGRALLLIKFPAFIEHKRQIKEYHAALHEFAGAERSLTLLTRTRLRVENGNGVVSRSRWFTLIDFDQDLEARLRSFAAFANSIEGLHCTIEERPTNH
jgi:hypothetical protein